MNVLILDCETTISNNGNPFDRKNSLVCVGVKWIMQGNSWNPTIFYDDFSSLQTIIDRANIIVGFNIKFDLHWLRKIGIDISKIKVWDCQIAEFILSCQEMRMPSLNDVAEKYGFPPKIDNIKLNYWDKGICTSEIPREELSAYLEQDLILTQQIYEKQVSIFKQDNRFPLFKLQCQDLLVLEEMEWNGIFFNTEKAKQKAEEIIKELDDTYNKLSSKINGVPFNPNSNDHVSCILYGGDIVESIRIPVGQFKTGKKVGEVRYKILEKVYKMPRLVEPIKGTEVKKPEGSQKYWLVNDTVLRKLKLSKEAKEIVSLLRKSSELEKLNGTYLIGFPKLIEEMNWEKDMMHGNLNQTVAITGRLSSSKPNQQNLDVTTKLFMETRY